jgi:spore coat polysaccharide biosynthesis predicted glycosyltransferase SpsG
MSAQNNPHSTIIPFTGVRYHRGLCICGETLCVEVSKLFQSIRDLWGHKKDTLTITGGSRKDGEQVTKQLMVQRWADYLKLNLDIVKSTATYNTETKKKTSRKTKKLRTITFILR